MIHEILTAAGFVKNKTYRETFFIRPPKTTYAVYNDSYNRRGTDNFNAIKEHDITIELYEYEPDPDNEAKIEAQLDARGIEYDKQQRYWLQDQQLYQVIYDFTYIEKEGAN